MCPVPDPKRLRAELRSLAALTSTGRGAQRVAWTETWARARAWELELLAELPVDVEVDEAGNLWATLPGDRPEVLILGSHIDSVRDGGWLDGSLGVLAGLEVMRTIAAAGRPPLTVKLVDWADEEGARFGLSLLGSSAVAGKLDPAFVAELRDADGIAARDALAEHGVRVESMGDARGRLDGAAAYLELHIEQGPMLEARGLPLAVVTGTYGAERWSVRFEGQSAHAGSTPMQLRHDALISASRLALAVREIAGRHGGVGTVGRIDAQPGIPTAVAGFATALVDQRHADAQTLATIHAEAVAASEAIALEEGVHVSWSPLFQIHPISFDADLIAMGGGIVSELQGEDVRLPSGPLHDAAGIADAGVPTVMLFVRSKGGLSHTPDEDTDEADLEAALEALWLLASRVLEARAT